MLKDATPGDSARAGQLAGWKSQAAALFFIDHLSITEIAAIVQKARKTVSEYINGCEGYDREMAFRKETSSVKRREYQRQWDRENRCNRYEEINGETLRREHELAAMALSAERY